MFRCCLSTIGLEAKYRHVGMVMTGSELSKSEMTMPTEWTTRTLRISTTSPKLAKRQGWECPCAIAVMITLSCSSAVHPPSQALCITLLKRCAPPCSSAVHHHCSSAVHPTAQALCITLLKCCALPCSSAVHLPTQAQ